MDNQFSPPPIMKETLMDFPMAIAQLTKGAKIARKEWNNTDYGFLDDSFLGIHKNGENFKHWNVNEGDLLAQDWVVIR